MKEHMFTKEVQCACIGLHAADGTNTREAYSLVITKHEHPGFNRYR